MEEIDIVIRIMPSGDELDLGISMNSTGNEILNVLIDNDYLPRPDNADNSQFYEIHVKDLNNKAFSLNETIGGIGVQAGYKLIISPKLTAA